MSFPMVCDEILGRECSIHFDVELGPNAESVPVIEEVVDSVTYETIYSVAWELARRNAPLARKVRKAALVAVLVDLKARHEAAANGEPLFD